MVITFKKLSAMLLTVISVALCSCSDDHPDEYLFVGDSIVKRWDIQGSFPTLITYNKGYFGSGIDYLNNFTGRCDGKYVVVLSGTNNILDAFTEAQINSFAESFTSSIAGMGAKHVYVISILPRSFETDGPHFNENIDRVNHAIRERLQDVPSATYVDVHDEFSDGNGGMKVQYSYDGLHLNSFGYEILTDKLNDYIL